MYNNHLIWSTYDTQMLRNGPDHNVIHGVHAKGIYMNGGGGLFFKLQWKTVAVYMLLLEKCVKFHATI